MNSFAALTFATLVWLLFRTLRIRLITQAPGISPYDPSATERYIYSVWHDSMVLPVFGGKHCCTTALTSHHKDGSFVAGVLRWRNIPAVRGSTSRIRTSAVRELIDTVASRHLVITPDGPRGPNRVMSPGIPYLASRTGRAVVPSGFACSSCWRWKGSWSDLIIPKPFAKVVLVAGAPIHVPRDLHTNDLPQYVEQIQAAMDELDNVAQQELGNRGKSSRQDAVSKRNAILPIPPELPQTEDIHSRAA